MRADIMVLLLNESTSLILPRGASVITAVPSARIPQARRGEIPEHQTLPVGVIEDSRQ
jgi:hypothetical protein